MGSDSVRNRVQADMVEGDKIGINATPTFFLNGSKTGVASWQELEPLLQKAGAR